jgi:hypothetical protein
MVNIAQVRNMGLQHASAGIAVISGSGKQSLCTAQVSVPNQVISAMDLSLKR